MQTDIRVHYSASEDRLAVAVSGASGTVLWLTPRLVGRLLDALAGLTRNIGVQVLEGNKVLGVRNTGAS